MASGTQNIPNSKPSPGEAGDVIQDYTAGAAHVVTPVFHKGVGETFALQSFSGTHTGAANAAVLTDSAANGGAGWDVNELIGQRINNTTDSSTGLIVSNTQFTITTTLTGGTDNDWDASDAYTIDTDVFSGGVITPILNNGSQIKLLTVGFYAKDVAALPDANFLYVGALGTAYSDPRFESSRLMRIPIGSEPVTKVFADDQLATGFNLLSDTATETTANLQYVFWEVVYA